MKCRHVAYDDQALKALEAPFRVVLPDDMPSWLE